LKQKLLKLINKEFETPQKNEFEEAEIIEENKKESIDIKALA